MRRVLLTLSMLAVLLGGFRMLSACLDVVPIVVEKEATATGSGMCVACIEQPAKCGGIIERCNGDPRCKPAYACITRIGCFELLTLDDKINCGLPCAADAGIQSVTDPVIADYLVGLVACAQEKCAEPCNFSDASTGL